MARPYYLLEEQRLRRNLALIADVARRSGCEIILAFKAFALWKTFPIFREYIGHTTASSPHEALLAWREFGSKAHTYSPAYEDDTFQTIVEASSHITFNSLSQYRHFWPKVKEAGAHAPEVGLRVNPEYSEIETDLYNPCAPGSRFGVRSTDLPCVLPEGITGFHCHNHCESDAGALVRSLAHLEAKFSPWFDQIKWLNLGGGHLMTRKGYQVDLLIHTLQDLRRRYPHLHVILEPGSAFAWQTGSLFATVVDIVTSCGIKTAILNVSFTCHMPDCLEMPYHPAIKDAETLTDGAEVGHEQEDCVYRLGGNSCLSGDFMGYWRFERPLQVGDTIELLDMIHYTTVKTNTFNGIAHPDLRLLRTDGTEVLLRRYGYEDYRDRMD